MATSASQIRSPFFRNPILSFTSKPSLSAFSVTHASRRRAPPRLVVVLSVANLDAKPTVLVSEKLGEPRINLLKQFANVDCSYNLSPEELCTKISLCDSLIVRSGTNVTHEVFESSGARLKVVGRAGVGIDNVDMAAVTEFLAIII